MLGYTEYGKADGKPVLYFHGLPGSCILPRQEIDVAVQLGVRLLVPERPGFGTSDFQPDREILDWTTDVQEFADRLAIDKFSVIGVSGGGPYAMACAYKMPERLIDVALLSSVAPFDAFGEPSELPTLAEIETSANGFAESVVKTPNEFYEAAVAGTPEPDQTVMKQDIVRDFLLATFQ